MDASRLETVAAAVADAADPVARARALRPLLDAHGPAMDAARELAPAVLDALEEADFFRLLTPRAVGGAALPLPVHARICEALARGDASTAWCVNQGNVSTMSSATYLRPDVARALFGDRRGTLAWGARHGRAKAVPVPGGYRVTGSWDFASGSRHAPTLGAHLPVVFADGAPRLGPNGKPEDVTVLFPKAQARIAADWDSLGLRATGSDTYAVEDLFVPEERAVFRDRLAARVDRGPITLFTSHICYAAGFAGTALGVARALLDAFEALARGKQARAGATMMRDNHFIHHQVGTLEARLRAAHHYLHGTLAEVWAEALRDDALAMDSRMALRLATTHAIGEATEVSVACYRLAGTTSVLASEPFERRFRDAMSVSQHLQGGPWHVEMVGRHALGVEQAAAFV